jgi:PAS domain S-box-containing protein
MNSDILILMAEAVVVYLLVLWTHSLRSRFGLGPFYALLGGITAIMSWVTDAGILVAAGDLTFMVGSTVFYTALLLGVFVVYVFDGPRSTRTAILTIAGVSILMPIIALVLDAQLHLSGQATAGYIPLPSLRINTASVLTTIADLIFLAMAWEFLGQVSLGRRIWLRAFLTLLGVMWLDVILFSTGAFAGTPDYLSIMGGTLLSRLVISLFACPFLYAYLNWQNQTHGALIENRPVLAILKTVADVQAELDVAQQEIARRKLAEAALQDRDEQLRNLVENAPVGIFHSSVNGRFANVNPALAQMLGYASPKELETAIDLTSDFYTDPAVRPALLQSVQASAGWVHLQPEWRCKTGDIITVNMIIRKVLDPAGSIAYLEGFVEDITERNRLEEERAELEAQYRQTQKTESLGRMAGAISHHINNLLQAMLGNLELALETFPSATETNRNLTAAMKAGNTASVLSQQILTYLGNTPRSHTPIDLAKACRQCLPLLRSISPAHVEIKPDLPLPGPVLQSSMDSIREVLTHLSNNAGESLKGKPGIIQLTAHTVPGSQISSTGRFPPDWQAQETAYACLTVQDSGCGIAPADIEKIFDPFFTTQFTGRGLGLSVVLGIMKAHQGVVTVESQLNRGTTLRAFFPLSSAPVPDEA